MNHKNSDKWEYKVMNFHGYTAEQREEILNNLGNERWELVNIAKNGGVYLKRRKKLE